MQLSTAFVKFFIDKIILSGISTTPEVLASVYFTIHEPCRTPKQISFDITESHLQNLFLMNFIKKYSKDDQLLL